MRAQSKSYQKIKASIPAKRSKSHKKSAPIDIDIQDFDSIGDVRYPLKELKIAHQGFGPNQLYPSLADSKAKGSIYE